MSKVTDLSKLKVALVHDYLRDYGGAERVLEALHETFPDAPVYVAFVDRRALGMQWQNFADWDIRESWLTEIPFYKKFFSPLRIFAPNYFAEFDFSNYDVVISSTNAYFAKAVRVPKTALHVCYCHTPSRSLYGYTTMTDWKKNGLTNLFGTLINHYLRVVDVKIAQHVQYFVANSHETADRIKKFYRRDSIIIYPPVEVPSVPPTDQKGEYFLYVNRLAFSKHPELAVQACTELKLPLKVVGTGKMLARLRGIAGPTIEFLGSVDDAELHELYAGAKALLYPVEDEDFGIVPIEAMGHGVPVIAHRSGGPKETIIENKTGIFFDDLTRAGLIAAIHKFEKQKFNRQKIYEHATQFNKKHFEEKIRQFISEKLTA